MKYIILLVLAIFVLACVNGNKAKISKPIVNEQENKKEMLKNKKLAIVIVTQADIERVLKDKK